MDTILQFRHVTFTGRLNTYGTITGTTYIYNSSTGRLQYIYRQITIHLQADYSTDTLQDALIHTVQLTFYNSSTGRLQYIYRQISTDTLQDALIHTVQLTFTIQIQYIYRAP